jgi:hypothetical protein
MTIVKVTYTNDTEWTFEDVHSVNYNYNGVGEIQIDHGKYHHTYTTIFIQDVETIHII